MATTTIASAAGSPALGPPLTSSERWTSYSALVLAICILGWAFDIYEATIMQLVTPILIKEWGITPATMGTVTTLSGISQSLPRYERALVDGSWLDLTTARGICASLRILDGAGRASNPCIGNERADLVLAGCAILEGILQVWPVPKLRVADRGLREGILLNLMREAGAPQGTA